MKNIPSSGPQTNPLDYGEKFADVLDFAVKIFRTHTPHGHQEVKAMDINTAPSGNTSNPFRHSLCHTNRSASRVQEEVAEFTPRVFRRTKGKQNGPAAPGGPGRRAAFEHARIVLGRDPTRRKKRACWEIGCARFLRNKKALEAGFCGGAEEKSANRHAPRPLFSSAMAEITDFFIEYVGLHYSSSHSSSNSSASSSDGVLSLPSS